jgi:hypothetical protein
MAKRKQTSRSSERLFADSQMDMFEKFYAERLQEEKSKPVKCLGMTFENDEKLRECFLKKLREKLKDPELRTFCTNVLPRPYVSQVHPWTWPPK